MEVNELPKTILTLVFVGFLIAIGAIVLINMGNSARTTLTAVNESHQFTSNGTGTALTQTEVKSFSALTNRTGTVFTAVTDYNVTIYESSARVIVKQSLDGLTLNATYLYYTDTTPTTAMDNVVTAMTGISTTWLALIITILALSVIMVLVLKSFGGR